MWDRLVCLQWWRWQQRRLSALQWAWWCALQKALQRSFEACTATGPARPNQLVVPWTECYSVTAAELVLYSIRTYASSQSPLAAASQKASAKVGFQGCCTGFRAPTSPPRCLCACAGGFVPHAAAAVSWCDPHVHHKYLNKYLDVSTRQPPAPFRSSCSARQPRTPLV